METLERYAILISLLKKMKECESWCGGTHIQKSVYFLQQMLGVPTGFDYILYKHGPFSFELRDELTAMRGKLILKLDSKPYPYGPSYAPGAIAEAVERRLPKTIEEYFLQVNFVANNLSIMDVADLERFATALYIQSEEMGEARIEDCAARIHELKPHISVESAIEALKTIEMLKEKAETENLIVRA
jgi:hypothetical protein